MVGDVSTNIFQTKYLYMNVTMMHTRLLKKTKKNSPLTI